MDKSIIKIMFVCHGNICRSPMAEFVMKDIVKKEGKEKSFFITSSATTNEDIGSDIHYGTQEVLKAHGINNARHNAIRLTKEDSENYDYFIGMDDENIYDMKRILNSNAQDKIFKLMNFTDNNKEIEDPWYTGRFGKVYDEIKQGCEGLFEFIKENDKI